MIVTLVEAKDHCRVDGTADDLNLTRLIAAATDYIEDYTGQTFPDDAPAAVKQAALLLIGQWFDNREGTADRQLSEARHAVTALLANPRIYAFGAVEPVTSS